MAGNPRTTTPTGYEPKEFATVSRIEDDSGDPYQFHDLQEIFGEARCTELRSQTKCRNLKKLGQHGLPNSKISETSYFQSQMHFDDSVESIADSDLEDGELQKKLTSPLYVQRASGKPDAMVTQEREVNAQYSQADRKGSLRSHSSEGQKASVKPDALFSSEQGNVIRSSVFRRANPSNLRGSPLSKTTNNTLATYPHPHLHPKPCSHFQL